MSSLFNDAKGQFAQSLLATLLESAGYRVQRFGVEEVLGEVKSVAHRREGALDLPPALSALPDLLVLDLDTGAAGLVEVKFRAVFDERVARELAGTLGHQQRHWPGTLTALVVADPPSWPSGRYQEHLRVLRPEDVAVVGQGAAALGGAARAWDRLATLGAVFPRVHTADGFHADADRLVPVIRAWATQ